MKKLIVFFLLVLVIAVAAFVYMEYNRTNADLKSRKAEFNMKATDLIAAFAADTASASKTYTDHVMAISGTIKQIDKDGNPVVIALGTKGEMSSVQCSMDSTHAKDYASLHEGDEVVIKGMCNGGKTEELFGTDVMLNRCVLENKK